MTRTTRLIGAALMLTCIAAAPRAFAECAESTDGTITCTIDHYRVVTVVYSPDTDASGGRMVSGERLDLYTKGRGEPRRFAVATFMSPQVLDFQSMSVDNTSGEYEFSLRFIRPVYAALLRQLRRTINPELIVTRSSSDEVSFARIVSEMENVRRPKVDTDDGETEGESGDDSG